MSEYSGTDNLEVMVDALNYNKFLVSLIQNEMRPNEKVVDFGAGIGTFALAVASNRNDVFCIEADPKQLERITASGLSGGLDLAELDDRSVDLLYSLNVFEHIENDMAVLKTCFEKIKPGGRIVIYVPAFQLLFSSMDRNVGHVRRYTRGEMIKKVRAAGFIVTRNEYVDSAGFLASLIFKFFGNDKGTINREALIAYDRYIFPLSRLADSIFKKIFGKNVFLVATRA